MMVGHDEIGYAANDYGDVYNSYAEPDGYERRVAA